MIIDWVILYSEGRLSWSHKKVLLGDTVYPQRQLNVNFPFPTSEFNTGNYWRILMRVTSWTEI